jgi:Beta-ketoacyl synthase, N-terminal domain
VTRTPLLSAFVDGIGLLGPGMADWPSASRLLAGLEPWVSSATVLPTPQCLPATERRRTSNIVKLALAVGLEASARAQVDAAALPAVFTSSGGDGQNCHEICQALAGPERQLSPTRFHNSVHNAAAGYWGIATGATPASNALCAHDASFAAGLLEALAQVVIEQTGVLLIAYDASYPEPMRAVRPIPDAFGVALVLAPVARAQSLACIKAHLSDAPADTLSDAPLERLRTSIPAARSLPLLRQIARRAAGRVIIDYLDPKRLALEVSACP